MSATTTEKELIEQLGSDKRSLRIQAIVKLTRAGSSEEALRALTPLASTDDREEAFFVSQAIAKISQKLGANITVAPKNTVQANNSAEPPDSQTITAKDFLEVKPDRVPILLQYVRTKATEIPDNVLPSIGIFLGKYGDKADAPFIQNYLINHHDNLTLPYISAAERIDPSLLTKALPYLLASNESLVRSRAVMALRKIDPVEAERHFLNLLASKQAENRLAALEISFLFPFDHVKDYILALLAEEKDLDVYKACATVLASNPSQEIALRILDIVESLPLAQRKLTSTIFNIVSAAIASAKVLPPEKATPQALVNTWKEQRLQNFLNDLEIQLSTTTGPKREAIVAWLEKNRNIPKVSEFIEQLALNPQTEDVYQRLTNQNPANSMELPNLESILKDSNKANSANSAKPVESHQNKQQVSPVQEPEVLAKSEVVAEPETIAKSETVSTEESQIDAPLPEIQQESEASNIQNEEDDEKIQIRYLKKLELEDFVTEKEKVIALADSSFTSVPLRVEALLTLLRLTPNIKIKQYGQKALAENDAKLKTAGFKILERVAPDALKDQLSDLLLSDDINIRVRAIRFGLKVDHANSIEALQNLINSEDQNTRSNAISCFALCPFEDVYEILMRALIKETHPLVAKQIIAIFTSNPDPAILSMLDKLCIVTKDPSLKLIISQARTELEETLSTLPADIKKSSLHEIDVFENNREDGVEDKPYSVENVRKLTGNKNQKNKEKEPAKSPIIAWIQENTLMAILSVSFVILLIIGTCAALNSKDGFNVEKYKQENRSKERSGPKNSKIPSSFRMNKQCTISGNIINIISEVSVVIKHNGRDVMVKFKNNEAKNFKVGDMVSVTCVPYRENPNGIILSNGSKISKVANNAK